MELILLYRSPFWNFILFPSRSLPFSPSLTRPLHISVYRSLLVINLSSFHNIIFDREYHIIFVGTVSLLVIGVCSNNLDIFIREAPINQGLIGEALIGRKVDQ